MLALFAALTLIATPESETIIIEACIDRGGTQDECSCGLDVAKESLTAREIDLFAELTPFLNREDFEAAFGEALALADAKGYSPAELLTAVGKVYEHAEEVETRCAKDG